MRKDVGVDGDAQRIGQLVWMLFLKIFDDREMEWELLSDNYTSPLPEQYRWRNCLMSCARLQRAIPTHFIRPRNASPAMRHAITSKAVACRSANALWKPIQTLRP